MHSDRAAAEEPCGASLGPGPERRVESRSSTWLRGLSFAVIRRRINDRACTRPPSRRRRAEE
eukprot:1566031-Alexandrium_andersonii.AAC.1